MTPGERTIFSKVPPVTLAFWIVKICATTVGDALRDVAAKGTVEPAGSESLRSFTSRAGTGFFSRHDQH